MQLSFTNYFGASEDPPPAFDMENEPTSDEMIEMMCEGSTIPLDEVKRHQHGAIFEEARDWVKEREPSCTARLQLADPVMLEQLAEVRGEDWKRRRKIGDDFPFQLICRRIQETTNSGIKPEGLVRSGYNPLWMNPADMERMGLADGDEVELSSRHGAIPAFVEAEETLREGVVAMTHGFGPKPHSNYDPRRDGSNINLLLSWDDDPDPFHGMPRMSAVAVAIRVKEMVR